MATRLQHGEQGSDTLRFLALGKWGLWLASIVVSVLAYRPLPDSIRIRWTVGTYYGPEVAPTALVLVGIPLVMLGVALAGRWLGGMLDRPETDHRIRVAGEAVVFGTLACLFLAQLAIVALNLG